MSDRYEIETVSQMLALSPEKFARMIPDLVAHYNFSKSLADIGAMSQRFTWVDDGKMGEIHSVILTIKETGETREIPGPAYEGDAP